MKYEFSDGGAKDAGFKSRKDCVCRAVSIATGQKYFQTRCELAHVQESVDGRYSGGNGIQTQSQSFAEYAASKGFFPYDVTPLALLPITGTFLVRVYRHLFCVKDGVLYDTWDGRFTRPLYSPVFQVWRKA